MRTIILRVRLVRGLNFLRMNFPFDRRTYAFSSLKFNNKGSFFSLINFPLKVNIYLNIPSNFLFKKGFD